jgi:hypothetical protein
VAIDDRFVVVSIAIAVAIFLDDSSISIPMVIPVSDNCAVVIPVAVSVMAFANCYASADRPDTDSDFFRARWYCCTDARDCRDNQSILHSVLLSLLP